MAGPGTKSAGGSALASRIKSAGIHYTPPELAEFLARHAVACAGSGPLRVLDPACGDGELLEAIARDVPARELCLTGLDTDAEAVVRAVARLSSLGNRVQAVVRQADFLEEVASGLAQGELFSDQASGGLVSAFDVVIANPPYVRTQVLGSAAAQELARRFGLSGRIDLYQAFVVGMAEALHAGGVLALLCSNRFMTTKSGRDLRRLLASHFDIKHLYDLGDTKLFSAAVLPAVVIAQKSSTGSVMFPVTSVYESEPLRGEVKRFNSVCEALDADGPAHIVVANKTFSLRRGLIEPSTWAQPWVATSTTDAAFLDQVVAGVTCRFKDIAKIRVGIKTTCDSVFIRSDWNVIDKERRPEPKVLLPLLTHKVASRWQAGLHRHEVLYPYDLTSECRRPLDLASLPRTAAYLATHRARLESRRYVTEAGRHWWEIWVPQRPALWSRPKIVFPDISEEPRFWLDTTGAVVNGDCYWMALPGGETSEIGHLMLAVANSSLATRFYDHACGNKLYSGRRRYISQYVEEFPLPDPSSAEAQKAIRAVSGLLSAPPGHDMRGMEEEIDHLVWRAFGFEEPLR